MSLQCKVTYLHKAKRRPGAMKQAAGDWSNYATWRLWTDLVSSIDTRPLCRPTIEGTAQALQAHIEGVIYPSNRLQDPSSTLLRGWAWAFCGAVDFTQLAKAVHELQPTNIPLNAQDHLHL